MTAPKPYPQPHTASAKDVIFTMGKGGLITSLNTEFEKLTGWSRKECLRKSFGILVHPDDSFDASGYVEEAASGEPQPPRVLRVMTKTGESRIVELTPAPQTENGRFAGVLVVARDITVRKLNEQQLQMLGHTITSMNECVVITDLRNNIIFVNPAFSKTYGYSEEEILGKQVAVLRPADAPSETDAAIIRETLGGGWQGEIVNLRRNGERFPVLVSTSAILDREGKPIALASIARDITEQKRLQEQLEESSRQRERDLQRFALSLQRAQEEERQRLSRDLHDDLGQLVTLIRIDLERALQTGRGEQKDDLVHHALRTIQETLARIHEIAVLLRPPVIDDFGLKEAIETYLLDFESKTGIHTVSRMAFDSTPVPKEICTGVYRILQEALTNVSRHSGAGSVGVDLRCGDGKISLSVSDEGAGFDYGEARAGQSLGLLGMRERIELMHGTFSLVTSPGEGTSIAITVPLPDGAPDHEPAVNP